MIPTGHVEAGLRIFDKHRSFPEEINRQLVSVVAELYFAPTKRAKMNLVRENIDVRKIYMTGNTVIDALYSIAKKKYVIKDSLFKKIDFKKKKLYSLRRTEGKALDGFLRKSVRQ